VSETPEGAGWVPRPDPTKLTTDAVNAATAQWQRELAATRELLETRLTGMDQATKLLSETVNRTPTVIQTEISHQRELTDEKFASVDQRFDERDVRSDQAARASKEALDAALLAAKELVSQQNEANAAAADKAEQSTIKQIDQIGIRIDTMQKALDDRLTELKERIDRGEGSAAGATGQRTETRLNTGQIIAAVGAMLAAAAIIVTIILATGH
jgi:hypothetical protein